MTRDGMLQTSQSWTGSPFFPTGPSTPTSSKAMGSIAFRSTPTEAGKITKLQTSRPLYHSDGLRAFGPNKLLMVEGETKGFLDVITVSGDKAQIDTVKDGFAGPVSLWQVGGTVYVLDTPLSFMFDPKLKGKGPPFTAFAVKAPQ